MLVKLIVLSLCLLSLLVKGETDAGYSRPSVVLRNDDGSIRGFHSPYNESDFFLGVLTRIHFAVSGRKTCSQNFASRGLESIEAILFALDAINNDSELLPNITLGYDVRDTCNNEVVAIDQTLDWIECSAIDETCSVDSEIPRSTFIGAIGASSSSVSVPLAGFFRVFTVPQISYTSTSPLLSDKECYPYFLRTVPPDTAQAQAMVDIVREFGWSIVTTVHSNDAYGEEGINAFHNLARQNGICIDLDEGLDRDFEDRDYQRVALELISNSTANVIVFFSFEGHVTSLLQQIQALNSHRRFTWIASDGWSQIGSIDPEIRKHITGMFGVTPFSQFYADFNSYYEQITPDNNARDPWFRDYCISFLSSRNSQCKNDSSIANNPEYTQSPVVPFVVDAVYSYAHALHNFLTTNCQTPVTWNRTSQSCNGQNGSLDRSALLEELRNLSFISPTSNVVEFDDNGDGRAQYEITNLQQDELKFVAHWDLSNKLQFTVPKSDLQFGLNTNGEVILERVSECTVCEPGSAQVFVASSCCTHCSPCLGNTYVNASSPDQCTECEENTWGNNPLNGSTSCVLVEQAYLSFTDPWGIVLLTLQIVGILTVTLTVVGLGIFWTDPVIKSFGREQLILVLVGLVTCFLLPVFYLFKPSTATCALQQIVLWFSLSIIFSALLVKLVRVTRIFLAQPTGKGRTKYIGSWYQVLFTFILVSVQMILVVISLVVVIPGPNLDLKNNDVDTNDFPLLLITCKSQHTVLLILQIVYESALIIAINGLAIFTIRFPENFNESKYIAFSTFAIGVVWMGFVPTYFATQNDPRLQSATIALAVMMMSFGVVICLILPRLYVSVKTKITSTTSSDPKHSMTVNSIPSTVSSGL